MSFCWCILTELTAKQAKILKNLLHTFEKNKVIPTFKFDSTNILFLRLGSTKCKFTYIVAGKVSVSFAQAWQSGAHLEVVDH